MRPCGATRAGTQAPPLPRSVIFFHTIPHKQNTIYTQSTQTKPTLPRAIHPNYINCPHVICPNETVGANIRAQFSQAKCVGAAPACPPERPHSGVSIPNIHALCAGNLTMDAPLWGDTGGHTGTAPTHLRYTSAYNPPQRHQPPTCNPPKRNA